MKEKLENQKSERTMNKSFEEQLSGKKKNLHDNCISFILQDKLKVQLTDVAFIVQYVTSFSNLFNLVEIYEFTLRKSTIAVRG